MIKIKRFDGSLMIYIAASEIHMHSTSFGRRFSLNLLRSSASTLDTYMYISPL